MRLFAPTSKSMSLFAFIFWNDMLTPFGWAAGHPQENFAGLHGWEVAAVCQRNWARWGAPGEPWFSQWLVARPTQGPLWDRHLPHEFPMAGHLGSGLQAVEWFAAWHENHMGICAGRARQAEGEGAPGTSADFHAVSALQRLYGESRVPWWHYMLIEDRFSCSSWFLSNIGAGVFPFVLPWHTVAAASRFGQFTQVFWLPVGRHAHSCQCPIQIRSQQHCGNHRWTWWLPAIFASKRACLQRLERCSQASQPQRNNSRTQPPLCSC